MLAASLSGLVERADSRSTCPARARQAPAPPPSTFRWLAALGIGPAWCGAGSFPRPSLTRHTHGPGRTTRAPSPEEYRSTAKDASQGRAPDVKGFDQDTAEDVAARVGGVLQVCPV
jgi:hypothetical protein